jgi:hypothetical protein
MRLGSWSRVRCSLLPLACALILAGCAAETNQEEDDVPGLEEETVAPPPPEAPKEFFLPTTCIDILSPRVYLELTEEPVVLLRGPGSGSPDPVYPDGSPQEELGGISCYFGDIEETLTYTLSIAPVTRENRAGVIDGLLEQKFNVDQTPSGALIYSIQGDEFSTPATYNTLYQDAWYEVLVSPGGRLSYEQALKLAQAMREYTYR